MRGSEGSATMQVQPKSGRDSLSDGHDVDPNTAPMRQDIRTQFTSAQMAIVAAMGILAITAGIVFGLLLAND